MGLKLYFAEIMKTDPLFAENFLQEIRVAPKDALCEQFVVVAYILGESEEPFVE